MLFRKLLVTTALVLASAAVATTAAPVRLELHLRHAHPDGDAAIEAAFIARTDPTLIDTFRQHMPHTELTSLVAAPADRIARTREALFAIGATEVTVSSTKDIITCVVPSASVGFEDSSAVIQRHCAAAKLPSAIRREIRRAIVSRGSKRNIAPVRFGHTGSTLTASRTRKQSPSIFNKRSASASAKNGDKKRGRFAKGGFPTDPGMPQTPLTIAARYKIPLTKSTHAPAPSSYAQGVAEFQHSFVNLTDLARFNAAFNLTTPDVIVDGPNSPSWDDLEGTLDIEYMTALNGVVKTYWISSPGYEVDMTAWVEQVLALDPLPSVVSISWGSGQFLNTQASMESDNEQFRKLGLRGVSILVASGDSGPVARGWSSCSRFMPNWPSASPYVTTVGATYATAPNTEEVAVYFSGGGFADGFPRPWWQPKSTIGEYLKASDVPTSFFNTTGRGLPDVSTLGTNFKILSALPSDPTGESYWITESGTSCAAPTFAAIISRINVERIQAKKPTLGFLNPALYSLGKVGQDVVRGRSVDAATGCNTTLPGWAAAPGWDAVSGLGTPDYEFLLANL